MSSKFNAAIGAGYSAWLLAIMVVLVQLYAPFKDMLKAVFGHHWVAKGIIITAVFIIAGFVYRNKTAIGKWNDDEFGWKSTLWSIGIIFAFFIFEYFVLV